MKNELRQLLDALGLLRPSRWFRVQVKQLWARSVRSIRRPSTPEGGPLLINLGCGENSSSEFVNVDVRSLSNIHHVHDIRRLPMFSSDSADLIYVCHALEHIPRVELSRVLQEWRRVLRPGGTLRISVPDFDVLLSVYRESSRRVDSIVNQLMGQGPPFDNHYSIWNESFGRELLSKSGFTSIRLWDPDTAPHHDFVDKSFRTMVTEQGEVPISLNIEADKA